MSNLRSTIENLASQFAGSIIAALRGASIDELLDVAQARGAMARGVRGRGRAEAAGAEPAAAAGAGRRRGRGGRLGRRSADDIARMVDGIVELLQQNPSGMRAEQIREALGVEAKELPRPLADAMEQGRITKSGQKRATTYFAGSGEGGGASRRRGNGGGGRRGGAKKKRG